MKDVKYQKDLKDKKEKEKLEKDERRREREAKAEREGGGAGAVVDEVAKIEKEKQRVRRLEELHTNRLASANATFSVAVDFAWESEMTKKVRGESSRSER